MPAPQQGLPGSGPGPQHGPDGPRRSVLFISPAGEPFRAAPGDPYPVAAWFAQADTNHDGHLTIDEMRNDAARFFATLDVDHDGEIDPDEVTRYETQIVPEIQSGESFGGAPGSAQGSASGHGHGGGHHGGGMGRGGGSGAGGGGMGGGGRTGGADSDEDASSSTSRPQATEGMGGAARYSLLAQHEPVTSADTDMNRIITLAEFRAAAERHFHMLESAAPNTDKGYLTLADLPKTPAQQMGTRRAAHSNRKH
ncbi:EF-hand domain-containing protein [Sphingomonas paeninsulae]|uniref:EF-hand domain-containing protein n=1 Tax=Sphingomonas paeninsulae TaxID=2319844 RepID=A0A494TMY9_SPHPE|nr:EF-hand domain-containing protein [Sphingomonas paeninsulae]